MFRALVNDSIQASNACETGEDRARLVQATIDHIHSLGGRFLRRHQMNGRVRTNLFISSLTCN
jgi:hypothetical protein